MSHELRWECPDCKAGRGQAHEEGCDVERCSYCGGQRIQCGCAEHDPQDVKWTGYWPGVEACRLLGLYCRNLYADGTVCVGLPPIPAPRGFQWHVPCAADDEGAREDLNRWTVYHQAGLHMLHRYERNG